MLVAVASDPYAIADVEDRHPTGTHLHPTRRRHAVAKPKVTKKEKLGVKIVVELTGHMPRTEVDQFMAALTSVVNNHLENGGNGGM
jgi:hypothetical protein